MEKERDYKLNGWVQRPLCVFCGAPWSDDMIDVEASVSGGCSTCGYGSETYGTIRINCHACGKLIYQKDFHNDG
jgi:hypothetical protein